MPSLGFGVLSINQTLSKVCKPALLNGLRCSSEAKLKINEQNTSKLKTKHVKNVSKYYRFNIIQYFLFKDKKYITNLNLFTQCTSLNFYRFRHVDFKTIWQS